MIIGDVLIDDKPQVTGTMTPTWEHIVFEAPYNKSVEMNRRLRMRSWDWWTRILSIPNIFDAGITKQEVCLLRDFSDELPNLRAARESYLRWRKGGSKGMQGSMATQHDVNKMIAQLEASSSARHFL